MTLMFRRVCPLRLICAGRKTRLRGSISFPFYRSVERELFAHDRFLGQVDIGGLRREWPRLYRGDAPRISRDLLVLALGFRLQEIEHGGLGNPTIADAILDRLVHNAHRLTLKGESLRKSAAKRAGLDVKQDA